MKDQKKSKAQLIEELVSLRQQVAELKSSEAERKQIEAQLRYQADLVENVSDAVISTDLDFNIKSWNKTAENIYGWQAEEVIGKPMIEVIETEYPYDRREQVLEQFFAEGVWKGEVIQKGKGDVSVNILASVSLFKDSAGNPVGAVAINRDITERKRVEEALRESEERFRTIFESAPIGICLVNDEGKALQANRVFQEIFDSTEDELRNKTFLDYTHPDDVEESLKLFQALLTGENDSLQMEKRYCTQDGHLIWAQVTVSTVRDDKGKFQYLVTMIESITERKQIEEALRESEYKFRSVVEQAHDGIAVVDEQGLLAEWNQAMERCTGLQTKEVVGRPIWDVQFHTTAEAWRTPEGYEQLKAKLLAFSKTGQAPWANRLLEREYQHPDGTSRVIQGTIYSIKTDKGFILVSAARDVTERKRAENLARIQRELAQALNAATRLEEGLRICVDAALHASGMDCGGIYLLDKTSGGLDLVFYQGLPPDFIRSTSRYEADSANVRLVLAGQPIYAQHQALGVPLDNAQRDEDLKAIAVLPVHHEEQVIGCLNVASHTFNDVPVFARDTLEQIAAQIGSAIAHLNAEEALRESEANLREAQRIARIGNWELDLLNGNVTWSEELYRIMKVDSQKNINLNEVMNELIHPDDRVKVEKAIENALSTGNLQPFEFRVIRGDGEERVLWCKGRVIYDEIGEPVRLAGIDQDITERKQAEEALRESEERYRRLVESSDDLIFGVDRQGIFKTAGGARLRAFGLKPEDVVNRSLYDLFPEEEARQYQTRHEQIFESGTGMTYEHSFAFAGVTKTDLTTLYPIKDERGQVELIGGICRDITERKQAEEALRESEERYRELAESITDVFFAMDENLRYTYWNKASEKLTGIAAADAIGKSLCELFPDTKGTYVEKSYLKVLRTQQPQRLINEYRIGDRDFIFEINAYPSQKGISVFTKDITKRKQAEEQIQASLREKEALLREIHHRVKNNLQVICALLDLQADAVQNEQVRVAFQESRNRIRSMAQIHEQLIHAENLAQIDMAAYVQELVTSLRVAHGTDAVLIKIDVSDITLPFDAVSPCGLLINELVSNALKHAFPSNPPSASPVETRGKAEGKDNEIRIMLRPLPEDENKMVLSVSDNGVGLPAEVDLEKPASLGLTLVNLLTRQLNATIEVERERGTRFRVVFAP